MNVRSWSAARPLSSPSITRSESTPWDHLVLRKGGVQSKYFSNWYVRYAGIYFWCLYLTRLWSHQMKAMYVFLHLKSQHLFWSVSKVLSTKLNPRLNLWRDLLLIHWTERCVSHYWDLAPISHYSIKIRHRNKLFSVLGGDIDISCRYDAASGAQEGGEMERRGEPNRGGKETWFA